MGDAGKQEQGEDELLHGDGKMGKVVMIQGCLTPFFHALFYCTDIRLVKPSKVRETTLGVDAGMCFIVLAWVKSCSAFFGLGSIPALSPLRVKNALEF
jgi:hypothetical protein